MHRRDRSLRYSLLALGLVNQLPPVVWAQDGVFCLLVGLASFYSRQPCW
jgi:hypothetical protein